MKQIIEFLLMAVIYLPCLFTNNPIIIDKPILIFYFCAGWAIEYLILFRNGTYIDVFLEYNRLANTPAMKEMKGLNLDYTGQDITNYVARGDDNWGNHGAPAKCCVCSGGVLRQKP